MTGLFSVASGSLSESQKGKRENIFLGDDLSFRARAGQFDLPTTRLISTHSTYAFLNSLPGHMVDERKSKTLVDMLWEGNILDRAAETNLVQVEIPLDYMEVEEYSQLNQGSTKLARAIRTGRNGGVDPITVLRQLTVRDRSWLYSISA